MSRMPIRCRNRFLWPQGHAAPRRYAVLDGISPDYPPATGRSHTRYSPVRRSPAARIAPRPDAPRLACVRPVASVHPEPGSNSSLYYFFLYNSIENFAFSPSKGAARDSPVLTLTFFTRLVLLCLSFSQRSFALSSPPLSQCVSVIPEKRVQR